MFLYSRFDEPQCENILLLHPPFHLTDNNVMCSSILGSTNHSAKIFYCYIHHNHISIVFHFLPYLFFVIIFLPYNQRTTTSVTNLFPIRLNDAIFVTYSTLFSSYIHSPLSCTLFPAIVAAHSSITSTY